jgi:hypothetical protein
MRPVQIILKTFGAVLAVPNITQAFHKFVAMVHGLIIPQTRWIVHVAMVPILTLVK